MGLCLTDTKDTKSQTDLAKGVKRYSLEPKSEDCTRKVSHSEINTANGSPQQTALDKDLMKNHVEQDTVTDFTEE